MRRQQQAARSVGLWVPPLGYLSDAADTIAIAAIAIVALASLAVKLLVRLDDLVDARLDGHIVELLAVVHVDLELGQVAVALQLRPEEVAE